MFFLIAGIRPRRRPVSSPIRRVEPCPRCGGRRLFEEARLVPYFDFFFIPLFPVGRGTTVYRCSHCGFDMPAPWTGGWPEVEVPTRHAEPEARDWGFGSSGRARASTEQQIHCVHCGRQFAVRAHTGIQRVHCPACTRDFEIGL